MENFEDYDSEMLVSMMDKRLDLDEAVFFILPELGSRKHPRTGDLCLKLINEHLSFDEYFVSSAITTLYSYNEPLALKVIGEKLSEFHISTVGEILSLLWVDSPIAYKNTVKISLIDSLRIYLSHLSGNEVIQIQNDYDQFTLAYGK